jgi:hypothetical protein
MKKNELKLRQAWFTIIRIRSKEHKGAIFFVNLLFFLPIPLFWMKLVIKFLPSKALKELPVGKQELMKLIGARGIVIDIKTRDGDGVFIKHI